jgi:hypothetical protein
MSQTSYGADLSAPSRPIKKLVYPPSIPEARKLYHKIRTSVPCSKKKDVPLMDNDNAEETETQLNTNTHSMSSPIPQPPLELFELFQAHTMSLGNRHRTGFKPERHLKFESESESEFESEPEDGMRWPLLYNNDPFEEAVFPELKWNSNGDNDLEMHPIIQRLRQVMVPGLPLRRQPRATPGTRTKRVEEMTPAVVAQPRRYSWRVIEEEAYRVQLAQRKEELHVESMRDMDFWPHHD